MNKIKLEKALIGISFEVLVNLSMSTRKHKKAKKNGYIYTCYKEEDKSLTIGYTELVNELRSAFNSSSYNINKVKRGPRKEIKYLKDTLKELGHIELGSSNKYSFNKRLKRDLKYLGW
tara:strand:- start:531 stop:884 length:354 start_codon:yes stop_codon:yes gene_type:complete